MLCYGHFTFFTIFHFHFGDRSKFAAAYPFFFHLFLRYFFPFIFQCTQIKIAKGGNERKGNTKSPALGCHDKHSNFLQAAYTLIHT